MKRQTYFKFFVLLLMFGLGMGAGCDNGGTSVLQSGTCADGLCVYVPDYTTDCRNTLHLAPEVRSNADIVRVEWNFRDLPVAEIQYDSTGLYPTLTNVGLSLGSTVCHSGTYIISLTVENSNGAIVIVNANIIIEFCGYYC